MQKDAAYMKLIEEISLNAWPSHKIELYDGWLIRFSHNYTYRTNSVEQVGDSLIPIEEKIAYCEAQYRNYHTPVSYTHLDVYKRQVHNLPAMRYNTGTVSVFHRFLQWSHQISVLLVHLQGRLQERCPECHTDRKRLSHLLHLLP